MKSRYLFLLLVAGATLSGYVLVFGDQGYLMQTMAETRLAETRAAIRGLEKENQNLSKQYARLKERAPEDAGPGGESPAVGSEISGTATILKFEDDSGKTAGPGGERAGQATAGGSLSIVEARALFLTGMFFLAILGYYGISRLERLLRSG